MKRFNLILLAGWLLAALPGMLHAQQHMGSVYIQQAEKSSTTGTVGPKDQDNNSFGLFSAISASRLPYKQLTGALTGLAAKINITGSYNKAVLRQSGSQNAGIIKINGSYNDARLTQNGANLFSFITITGNSNIMHVNQQGHALQNYIKVQGTGIKFNVDQKAGGVQLTQLGGNAIPLQIKSTATSIPIIIHNH